MYACFVLFERKGWHFSHFAESVGERDAFIGVAKRMAQSHMLGDPPIGYDVHEVQNQYNQDNQDKADQMTSKLSTKVRAFLSIQQKLGLTNAQMRQIEDSDQFDAIVSAVGYDRWDQVTILLIQEKIMDKWPS